MYCDRHGRHSCVPILNELAVAPRRVLLALDDYHVINQASIHTTLRYLIDHAPPQLHLILISRHDPPCPLLRWRSRREVSEIREHELRFTFQEAETFLNQVMQCNLPQNAVEILERRTEGWIVSLQLAALSMQGRQDSTNFIGAFRGSHVYIVDYLTEEVLLRQPSDLQRFLAYTSILGRFCAPLCDDITGQTGSQRILEQLERTHLFVQSLDAERTWYRYHYLFGEMLRKQLHEREPVRARAIPLRLRRHHHVARCAGRPGRAVWHTGQD